MINSKKKGFTIVELVIVIAVIAVLSAVLIPTFSNLVKKANVSSDTALVKNLNTALAADTNEHNTMGDALTAAKEYGYDIAKINAKAKGNEILWDSKNDCFVYLDRENNELVYIPDSKTESVEENELWIIYDEAHPIYSTYLYNFTGTEIEAIHSLDASACNFVDVTYKGNAEVLIITNGGSLTVESGSVTHYGTGYILTVADAAKANYVEKGSFAANSEEIVNAGTNNSDYKYVGTAEALKEALGNKEAKIALSADININAEPSVGDDFTIEVATEINLNGYNIYSIHNYSVSGVNKNNGVFYVNNGASLKLTGSGEIVFDTNNQMGWNACTYVIAGNGDLVIDGAIAIINKGETDMSYAIDMRNSSSTKEVNVTINSGYIYSKEYNAIRLFATGSQPTFNLNINGGVIEGNRALMVHDGNDTCDGIYNITLNGGTLISSSSADLIKKFQNNENVKLLNNGATVVTK